MSERSEREPVCGAVVVDGDISIPPRCGVCRKRIRQACCATWRCTKRCAAAKAAQAKDKKLYSQAAQHQRVCRSVKCFVYSVDIVRMWEILLCEADTGRNTLIDIK